MSIRQDSGTERRAGGARGGFWRALFALATLSIAATGAGIAWVEYHDAQQRSRIDRVLGYANKLTDMAEANARISKIAEAFFNDRPDILDSAGGPSGERLMSGTQAWYREKIEADDDLRFAVEQLSLFYDGLSVCVAQELCDEKTAKALFRYQTETFTSIAYPWIAYRHGEDPQATGVQAACLRNRFCGGQLECSALPQKLASCEPDRAAAR